ncbi:hypothetical protein EV644_1381, partial [Kribbella orskensis]
VAADREGPDPFPAYATPTVTNGSPTLNSEEPLKPAAVPIRVWLIPLAPARRKIVPEALDRRVVDAFASRPEGPAPLFRKTSCAVSFVHGLPDYNGHYGIRELCDICPMAQLKLCANSHRAPTTRAFLDAAAELPEAADLKVLDITGRAVQVDGLASEQPRYFLQHAFAFQVHDAGHPHHLNRHGRADIGWEATTNG